jgi:glycosyltransferase involved in cell wall biosynthesis
MKIGYLHLGPDQHGINRYGRLLAVESKRRSDLFVLESEVVLTDDQVYNRKILVNAAQHLAQADFVHIQFSYFNDLLWGEAWEQLDHLQMFLRHCSCPIVATLHDVYYVPTGVRGLLTQVLPEILSLFKKKQKNFDEPQKRATSVIGLRNFARTVKGFWINNFGSATATLKEITKNANLILVCSQEESSRLVDRVNPQKLKVIPHFVESRPLKIPSIEARKYLNLIDKRVVTLLGFISPYKGHQLVVEAIPYLPLDVQIIFAGNKDLDKEFVHVLQKLARGMEVEHRLRFTGYLTEGELDSYLIATDLAICPFKGFSASGSISTWISVACPILSFDLPQIREYNLLEADAIKTFNSYTPMALATAIQECLEGDQELQAAKVAQLGQKLSLPNILDKHLTLYQAVNQYSDTSSICQS